MVAGLALSLVAVIAQSAPTFEVASVRRAVPGTIGGRVQFLPGGRFVGTNVSLDFLLQQVYDVRDFPIVAAPEWRAIIADGRDSRYEIQARGPESASREQLKEMAKTLLADRFRLKLHRETRDLPVYALVQARGGVKGARAQDGPAGGIMLMAPGWTSGKGVTIEYLAQYLSRIVDRPVVDRTNLTQVLDFHLTWTPEGTAPSDTTGCPASFQTVAEQAGVKLENADCPSLFTAVQEQLGLRLEPRNAPIEVLVIDHVEYPVEN